MRVALGVTVIMDCIQLPTGSKYHIKCFCDGLSALQTVNAEAVCIESSGKSVDFISMISMTWRQYEYKLVIEPIVETYLGEHVVTMIVNASVHYLHGDRNKISGFVYQTLASTLQVYCTTINYYLINKKVVINDTRLIHELIKYSLS